MNVQNLSTGLPGGQSSVQRIDVRGLSKTFQLAGTAIEAVRDVSFGVRRGEFVALLGPSGRLADKFWTFKPDTPFALRR